MAKRSYKSINVKSVDVNRLLGDVGAQQVSVGVDVAKTKFYAALMLQDGEVVCSVTWLHPAETPHFLGLLSQLPANNVAVALESTSRYGDILVARLRKAGIAVHGASTKRVHDAAEEYDGVPSKHDAKDAAVIADLLRRKKTRVMREPTADERRIRSMSHLFLVFKAREEVCINRLEAELARFWPEVTAHLGLQTISLLTLLATYGTPAAVAAAPKAAKDLLRSTGRSLLKESVIDAVVACAGQTQGCEALSEEQRLVCMLAQDALRAVRDAKDAEKSLHTAAGAHPSVVRQAEVIGMTTVAVVVAKSGDIGTFASPAAYLKNIGLNLKERSSGKSGQRGVSITKRGAGMTRRYLFLASLRLLQNDPVVALWYQHQVSQPQSVRKKVVTALMRKLVKALWHVARGDEFDARKLFDTRLFMSQDAIPDAAAA